MKRAYCFLYFLISAACAYSQTSSFIPPPTYEVTVYDTTLRGYYFVPITIKTTSILDNYGDLVCYVPKRVPMNFSLAPDGKFIYSDLRQFYLMDSAFRITDTIACPAPYKTDPRELQILPNGHFLMLATELVTMKLGGYCCWRNFHATDTSKVTGGIVLELDRNKNVVFEWHAKDHFAFDDVDTFYGYKAADGSVDWTHFNSAGVDSDGNILLSSRNFNEVTKINRKDGSVMWRMGGKKNEFRFVNCPVPFYGQHDARRIDNGHVTLFDGGNARNPHGARALEFEIDEVKKIAKLKWSYTYDSTMHSVGKGGNVQFTAKNVLVNYGTVSKIGLCYVVINKKSKKKLMEVKGVASYRTVH